MTLRERGARCDQRSWERRALPARRDFRARPCPPRRGKGIPASGAGRGDGAEPGARRQYRAHGSGGGYADLHCEPLHRHPERFHRQDALFRL